VDDFVAAAKLAADAGAPVVESNFSCPNVTSAEGSVFTSVEMSGLIATKLVAALGDTVCVVPCHVGGGGDVSRHVCVCAALMYGGMYV